ncbi:MAG TPA: zinc metallopeptidase [Candidatus Faecisoma merdavium]|nr:zinc metallopeptidase [Candidatus Faecisoma merdavium]
MDFLIYYGLGLLGLIIVLWAQANVTGNYKKYLKYKVKSNLSGQEVARKILDANGLNYVHIVETKGELTDHYDPTRKVIRLSSNIFHQSTISSVGVAAHEVGHAIQDKEGYSFMRLRSALVPFVNFVSYLGYFGLIISIFAGLTGYLKISILILCVTILFQLVTLPVEFDASKRAKEQLISLGLIDDSEHEQVSKVLFAAAMTYVAGLISNLLQLLRLVLILNDRD